MYRFCLIVLVIKFWVLAVSFIWLTLMPKPLALILTDYLVPGLSFKSALYTSGQLKVTSPDLTLNGGLYRGQYQSSLTAGIETIKKHYPDTFLVAGLIRFLPWVSWERRNGTENGNYYRVYISLNPKP